MRLFFRENGPKMGSLWRSGRRFLHNGPERAVFRKGVQTWFRIIRPFNKAVEEIESISNGSIHMDFDYDDINTFLGGKMNVGIDATMQSYIQQIEKNKTVKQIEAKKKPAKKPPQSTQ